MYRIERTLFLRETDATGVLYFSELFKLALEAFEVFLMEQGASLQRMIDEGTYLMPIVHASGNFYAPMRVSDRFVVELALGEVGTSSFTLVTQFLNARGELLADAKIVHVAISRDEMKKMPIPDSVLRHLLLLRAD